jgi:hypothetical protein
MGGWNDRVKGRLGDGVNFIRKEDERRIFFKK